MVYNQKPIKTRLPKATLNQKQGGFFIKAHYQMKHQQTSSALSGGGENAHNPKIHF
jgi:hypothetical protein